VPALKVAAEHVAEAGAANEVRLVREQMSFLWRLLRRPGVAKGDADDAAQQAFIANVA